MKKFARGFCSALMLAGLSAPAFAAPPAAKSTAPAPMSSGSAIEQGAIEVSLQAIWVKADAIDAGAVILGGGYMYTDNLEFKANWTHLLGDTSGGFITPGADWFFTNLKLPVIPYAGGGFSLGYGDVDDFSSLELRVGVKQFLTERTTLDYRFAHEEPTDSDFDGFDIFTIGFSYYL